jgi:catechol 2,3-dioxygenase-like lactoylglutathione lyase family enzyme
VIDHIIHVNIRVPASQLSACRDFYCEFLELLVGPRPPFTSMGFWLYAGALPVVHLVAEESAAKTPGIGHAALDHVAFRCRGLHATLERLQARNIGYRISTVPTLDVIQVSFADPVGVGIELSFEDVQEVEAFRAAPPS